MINLTKLRLFLCLGIFGLLVTTAAPSAVAQYPPTGTTLGTLTVSDDTVFPGQTITISGSGYSANAGITTAWDGGVVENPTADSSGRLVDLFTIPLTAGAGSHTISAEGSGSGGGQLKLSAQVTVFIPSAAGELPLTGGTLLWVLLATGIVVSATGLGLRLFRR